MSQFISGYSYCKHNDITFFCFYGHVILSLMWTRLKGRDTQCEKSRRRVTATNPLVWHVKIIVAATEFCRCNTLREFKLVWIRATYRSDKISASNLVAPCVRICDKSLRQNLNQPMRKHQSVSLHVKLELVYISSLPKSSTCTEQVSYGSDLSQDQCRRGDLSLWCVAIICCMLCLGLNSQHHF